MAISKITPLLQLQMLIYLETKVSLCSPEKGANCCSPAVSRIMTLPCYSECN